MKDNLIANIDSAKAALAQAEAALESFIASPENNVFESLEAAEADLEDRLNNKAYADCQGAYNCGDDKYEQEFIVDGKHYIATLECEYNRHDKTYYYIDGSEFSVREVEATQP